MLRFIPLEYRLLAVAAAVLALFGTGYWKGHSAATARCHEAELRAEIAAMKRDRDVAAHADATEQKLNDEAARQAATREQELESYVDTLRRQKDCRRTLDGDDVDRLRRIDGKARP